MKIVVDTNILFSALLNSKGKIGDLIFNSFPVFEFYAANFLKKEIKDHHQKLLSISGFSEDELNERKALVFDQIRFIDEFLLPESIILFAENLVLDIDPDDILHVAFAEHLKAFLWTGDKKLKKGLKSKDYKSVLDTNGLWKLRDNIME